MSHADVQRTCIATRTRRNADELLRVVVDRETGVVVPDPHRRLPGRGAWITPTLVSYEAAQSRRAFGRALRVSGVVDTGHVRTYLADYAGGPEIVRKTEH